MTDERLQEIRRFMRKAGGIVKSDLAEELLAEIDRLREALKTVARGRLNQTKAGATDER